MKQKRHIRYLKVQYDLLPINVLREMGEGCPFCRSDKTILVVHAIQHGFEADNHIALGECLECTAHFGAIWLEPKVHGTAVINHQQDTTSKDAFSQGGDK